MNIAIVPANDSQLNDNYFLNNKPNSNYISDIFSTLFKECIENRGDIIHTIDWYDDLDTIDFVFLLWPRWEWISFLANHKLLPKTIYLNAEPTSVIKYNSPKGYKWLKNIFRCILTWNDDWVDNKIIYKKNIPYIFEKKYREDCFDDRKLLTAITADKSSSQEGELYSERRNVYKFFEDNYPKDFIFYGTRWKEENHPCYGGIIEDKFAEYHKFKFAICLENTTGINDYITEKIYDCMCAGIVPIYGGALNIKKYVNEECFIDYFSFKSYYDLAQYIINMTCEEYNRYLDSIDEWIDHVDMYEYSVDKYVDYIYEAIESSRSKMVVSFKYVVLVNIMGAIEKFKKLLARLKQFILR